MARKRLVPCKIAIKPTREIVNNSQEYSKSERYQDYFKCYIVSENITTKYKDYELEYKDLVQRLADYFKSEQHTKELCNIIRFYDYEYEDKFLHYGLAILFADTIMEISFNKDFNIPTTLKEHMKDISIYDFPVRIGWNKNELFLLAATIYINNKGGEMLLSDFVMDLNVLMLYRIFNCNLNITNDFTYKNSTLKILWNPINFKRWMGNQFEERVKYMNEWSDINSEEHLLFFINNYHHIDSTSYDGLQPYTISYEKQNANRLATIYNLREDTINKVTPDIVGDCMYSLDANINLLINCFEEKTMYFKHIPSILFSFLKPNIEAGVTNCNGIITNFRLVNKSWLGNIKEETIDRINNNEELLDALRRILKKYSYAYSFIKGIYEKAMNPAKYILLRADKEFQLNDDACDSLLNELGLDVIDENVKQLLRNSIRNIAINLPYNTQEMRIFIEKELYSIIPKDIDISYESSLYAIPFKKGIVLLHKDTIKHIRKSINDVRGYHTNKDCDYITNYVYAYCKFWIDLKLYFARGFSYWVKQHHCFNLNDYNWVSYSWDLSDLRVKTAERLGFVEPESYKDMSIYLSDSYRTKAVENQVTVEEIDFKITDLFGDKTNEYFEACVLESKKEKQYPKRRDKYNPYAVRTRSESRKAQYNIINELTFRFKVLR